MRHQIKQVFHSPKFVVGFIIFMIILIMAIFYPMISSVDPLQNISKAPLTPPGTYVNVEDTVKDTAGQMQFELPVVAGRVDDALNESQKQRMIDWLVTYGGVAEETLSIDDVEGLINTWNSKYDPTIAVQGTNSLRDEYKRIAASVSSILSTSGITLAEKGEEGLEAGITVKGEMFINVNDVANTFTFPLGADNFGRDVLTELTSAIRTSLQVGLIAGLIATAIGLALGLLAGYVGGVIDNFITFITNIFTVIPSFVLLILIANAIGGNARGVEVVAMVIGFTSWPWTCRSVRSQVLSLRNRDHVNLSKLSGHSMPKIILRDILPYVASYVVMALILQISSGILAEAQLSMLGLGPSTTKVATLGLMMNWAQKSSAWQIGAWWHFLPVILSIAFISFSLNLMNTGLDQVFNPQLRDS